MTEMLLFGAGASVEGQVPDSNEMTERIVGELGKAGHPKRHIAARRHFRGEIFCANGTDETEKTREM